MSNNESFFVSNLPNGEIREILINNCFEDSCPLNESQLNVYMDETQNNCTAYNNPFKIRFDGNYSLDDIKQTIDKLFNMVPVLSARIVDDGENISFAFDAKPQVIEGSIGDVDSFVRPFDLEKNLSKFLMVKEGDSNFLYADFHHLIFDYNSLNILMNKLTLILNGDDCDFVDDGVLRRISLENYIIDSKYKKDAEMFYESVLCDSDEVYELSSSIKNEFDDDFKYISSFDINLSPFLQNHSISNNQFFTSVFAYTLSRFAGSSKVLFNLIEDIRSQIDSPCSIGMLSNMIPLLFDCKNQGINSYFEYCSNLINSATEFSMYPFSDLQNEYNSNIAFQYVNDALNNDAEELKHDLPYDLLFYVSGEDAVEIKIIYSDKFSNDFIKRFADAFKSIANAMIKVDELSDIKYTSSSDLEILEGLNKTEHPLKYDDILDAFNDNLARNPEGKLVSCRDNAYTYSEGAFIADKIAKRLMDLDIKEQDNVAFLTERCEHYMFSVLGILSVGAVYVPLDDTHPDDRIQFILKDTASKVVIVSDETLERVEELCDASILNISQILNEGIGELNNLPVVYGDLACMLYTSGTTGLPKGVKVPRIALLNLSGYYVRNYGLSDNDVFGLFSAIGFDAAYKAIFAAIYAGACLDVIPGDVKLDMNTLNDYFIKQGINHVDITTQVAKLLITQIDELPLDVLFTGGEKLGDFDEEVNCRFVDGYGPTEAYVEVSTIDVDKRIDSSSIGSLVDNIKAYVLDDEFRRVPVGAVGELYLAGNQIAYGYLHRDEETAKAFLENPFEDNDEYGIMYRTGDLVKFLPNGTLGVFGRRDSQVKIRGNRLELSEVEAVVREIAYVDDVTIQTVKHGSNNELVAYVVLDNDFDDDDVADLICEYVRDRKPEYMVPSFVISLDAIPLNVNGKVDKRALPEVDVEGLRAEYVAPTTDAEKQIVEAFEKVFEQEGIGIYDDFVRLGGDSLSAIKLLYYIDDYNLSSANILSLRTPKAIAASIKEFNLDLDIYSLDGGCPLNEPQLNVYLDIMANEKSDSYLIPFNISISKDYVLNELTSALSEMFRVHPILEMKVNKDFDVPYLVKGNEPLILIESDVDDSFIKEFITSPFDLEDSLCRFLIVDEDECYKLYAVFHHLTFDGMSVSVFVHDIFEILHGNALDTDDSFLKVSAFNNQISKTDEFKDAALFYESMLVDVDEAGVLLESISPDAPGNYNIDLEADITEFMNKFDISENILFTGVFAYTLSRFVGDDNVFFNIVENGRDRFNNFDSIGMFVNTLPLLVDCKNQDVSSFMNYMSDLVYGVMGYNYYPYRLLANDYNINSNILFQYRPTWFMDDEDFIEDDVFEDMENVATGMNDFISDLSVVVTQMADDYNLDIQYSDKYSKDLIERIATSFKLILHDIIEVDKLSQINYTSSDDLMLLDSFNQTEHPLTHDDIMDAFNDNLGKNPDSKLVSCMDRSYTYGEGAFIADMIAKQLIELGVKEQDNVAFLTERCEHYMFASLGILSIGAICVPLDDKHPDERLEFILKDTDSKVVIVSDETYKRANELSDASILNISDMIKGDIGSLNTLPVAYGDLACMLYTSGTTGIPKGVKITRKSVLNLSQFYSESFDFTCGDVYALYSSISFDAGPQAIFQSVYAGACLSVVPEDIRFNILKLNEYFIRQNVTHTFVSTQVGKLFMEQIDKTSLKSLSVGGEKLGDVKNSTDYNLIDEFGPTEAFAFISSIDNSDKVDESSIGFFNYNSKEYILDSEGRRVPFGAIGELCISGYQVADGYLNRDEETIKSFLDNPFDSLEGYAILYRTGDLVRMLPDGSLGIVGRIDEQVKIRGNRVELSEIESVIRQIDYVDDVTVQTIKHGSNNELIAYVVISNDLDENTLADNIRGHVSKNKPDYMIPSYVIGLDEIPLNVNGKVDKRALPEIDIGGLHVEYVAATNDTEKLIMDSFESIFNLENIGLFDDFVRLGGDSISAIRVIAMLQKNGVSCTARDILNYKTPYLIAQNLKEFDDEISHDAVEGEVDLLPIQSYFFDQNDKSEFAQQFILKSKVDLNSTDLQNALDELSNIHDMLRAVYKFDDDGNIIQEILPLNTRVCEVREYTIHDLNNEFNSIFINSVRSLDIHEKLLDVTLIHYHGNDYVLFNIHHLIIDGVSWNILLVDLTYIYYRLVKGEEIDLSRPYPYRNWVEDVKGLVSNISDEEKQHWVEINGLLNDSDIKGKTNIYVFNVDVDYNADNLLMLSEEEYWALAIARAYKKTFGEDIIFNRESHGRDDTIANLNRTIGWFTSQYPVLVDVSADDDGISLINDVYNLKSAFKDIKNLGLNYGSLIYTTEDLEFKNCPVTFNFLSSEFVFENVLFKSINDYLDSNEEISLDLYDDDFYGISFNVSRTDDVYLVGGAYAMDTYIGDQYSDLVENIKKELKFIANYNFEDNIVCSLSEPQMGVYLDEKVNDKGVAYSTSTIFECDLNKSVADIKNAINSVIDKHPILKGRILDNNDLPLLVCDSYPLVDVVNSEDIDSLVKPFDLGDNLARFFIIDAPERKAIFFDIHHIISDATTISIIVNDLTDALEGNLDSNVDLGFVYSSNDFFDSKFQSNYDSAHEFFARNFAEIDEIPTLLGDVDSSEGSVILPIRGIKDKLESFAHENGITVGNLLNAVFAYTYSRFTGNNRVYFNIMEHGRHEDYVQEAVGIFVRTIPLVVDCSNVSVKDYVSHVSDLVLDSMANSIYPFRLLASEFNLSNDIFFEYNSDLNDMSFVGEDIILTDYAMDTVGEFSCVANDLDDGYAISVDHSDKYSQETAERFVYVFKEILTQILDKTDLKDIDYVSSDDLNLLKSYNQTDYQLDYEDVLDAFNDNLSENPDNKLVSFEDIYYTYGEGAFVAQKIAEQLIELGVKPQDNVAFLTERSQYYMFNVLSILSAGAVYVPLDDNHPNDRIQFILEDTASKVVIVSDETYERVKGLTDAYILNISDIFKEEIGSLNRLPVSYGDLACILYTSGTTGIPKGVKITRKSLLNVSESYINDYNLSSSDVYGLFSSIGFDVSSFVISAVMCSGACLSVIPEDIRLNMFELNRYFIDHNVSHAFITTQVGKLFMQSVDETSLELLLVAGEKLGEFDSPEGYQLVDAYGPTEAFAFVTSINNSDKQDYSSVGLCNCNTKYYVLDDELRQVPIGAVGELYIAGHQVADGYLNREEETGKAFIDNPFCSDENYHTLYRTGDMVRVLPDGTLGIVGRRDSQVKIRGNRVELSEIEAVIRDVNYVEDVSLQTFKNGTNNELVAYVVSNIEDETTVEEEIRSHVLNNKPDYMVPSFFIFLDEIPLNVNGKVDKRALPEVNMSSLRAEYLAPSTKDEKVIVDAFEKVFDLKRISLNDDFIHLGGDSLTAIKLLSYLEGYNITASDILSLRTPLAIAGSIREFTFDLDMYCLEEGCPLTESQLNIYLDIISNSKTDSFLIPLNINVPEKYGVDELTDALEKMFAVHPILEMKVSDEFDVPYLVKGRKPPISIESNVSDEFGREFVTKPFDLEDGLCRFLILKNDEIYMLFAVFHHLIFDGLSASVFEHNLFEILGGKYIEIDDSFLQVSAFNSQICEMDEFDNAALFYESMLADIDEVDVLLDSVCPDGPGSYDIDLEIDIGEFMDKYDVSENVLFTSVFAYTLSRFMGDEKVFFNIVENGRDRFNNFNSIGMFVNTLPVLVDCKDQDVGSFMDYMSDLIYGVLGYNYYPYRLLANDYDINSDILFQFKPDWFIKEEVFFSENTFDNKVRDEIFEDMNDFITDFEVEVIQNGSDYSLNIIYSNRYSKDMVERFAESYKLILAQLISVERLSDINYVSESDLELLDFINQTEYDLIYDDILDAFNNNLSNNPDSNLVSFNEDVYTYAEGAFIADKIAESLKGLGVVPGDNVAFLVERSELYMFSVLGILSVGATYVPLDDAHPDERIEFILNDTEPKVVLVSDKTCERTGNIIDSADTLNISNILKDEIGTLDELPVVYGDLACMLYTSGTTGIPKGVKVTRKSALNVPSYYNDAYGLKHDDVYGMFATIGFDAGSWAILSTICAGACLAIIPEDIRLDMNAMNDYFIKHNVTHTFITTQVGKLFVDSVGDTSLNVLVVGGEKLGEFTSPENYELIDIYGPTEAFVFVASKNNKDKIDSSSVGDLIYNTKAYILDEEFRRVPVSAVGELYLAGDQIAEGYLNNEEETTRAFINNPFDDGNYDVLYRTGDMVRVLSDNSLSVVGRRDSQVKIRGNRVELLEVESVVRKIPFVDDVTVQTVVNHGNNELVAYITVSDEVNEDNLRNDVREFVANRKPDYMIPSFVVKLDEIPLNVNGKVDKRALPKVDFDNMGGEYVAPSNDVEAFFVECFEELLGVNKISVTDDFFEMGGDSMLVIKIIYKSVNEGYSISYADLFNNPTPKALSNFILSAQPQTADAEDDYDYSLIDNLLQKNNMDSFYGSECEESLGNVLLTGVTGYLGIHILYELLENETGDIYCLIRSKKDLSIEERLNGLLNYYFGRDFTEFKGRIHLVEGDITNPDDLKKLSSFDINTVINSAANVKHFAHGSEIKDINLYGAINVLEFAKLKKAKFVQVSTCSVSGIHPEDMPEDVSLGESDLFIGQDYVSNKYVESKYLAERSILESVADDDLDVKIMRVGNLMARSYDSRFQQNFDTNAFINSLKSYVTIGKVPESVSQEELEFSPIDLTAKAIVMLSKTPKDCTVFHPATNRIVTFAQLVDVFNKLDLNVEIVDDEIFNETLNDILMDESKQEGLFGIGTELNDEDVFIPVDKEYTLKVLSEFGFEWPQTSEKYLSDFINSLKGLGFFNI
ncbi:amino acid adenylation domain-containing protein [Methanobrevibacter sp.]|uniref:amino acid adenylation domain-containing protein n=1 Tax=Methanobrevibacter sp. TaxID=66852 RepID=UPI00386D3DB1